MPDIIFHIGMPKCASTTLQNQIFNTTPGYLGTGKGFSSEQNFAKRFQALAPVGPRLRANMPAARQWAKQVLAYGQRKSPGIERFIASSELLTNRNKLHPRPIIPFLKRFSDEIWLVGQVKVILVLRNPADRLASSYAQSSAGTFGASQSHFERHINNILDRDLNTLDVATWVSDLFDALGPQNVCVLLLEDIGQFRFWQQLKDFAGLDQLDPERMISSQVMNRRRRNASTWEISELDLRSRAKSQSGKVVGVFWPGGRMPALRRKCILRLANVLGLIHRVNPGLRHERYRGREIKLTEDIRMQIQARCGAFHDRLSVLLGRDLSTLGY